MEEREEDICGFNSPFGEALTGTLPPLRRLGTLGGEGKGEVATLFNCIDAT